MIAVEVWINDEKKCVAGTNDNVLTAIVNAMRHPHGGRVTVGGLIEKEVTGSHANWINLTPIQLDDEIRVRLIETEEVDAPIEETRSTTQAEQDEEVRLLLAGARAMLPDSSQESDAATLTIFDERLEQQNVVTALHLLAELGELNAMPAPYWKQLAESADELSRYEDAHQYRERAVALTPKDENPTRPDATQIQQNTSKTALEIWINGEKKCVAGNNGKVLSAIVDAMRHPHIHVGGMMDKGGSSFHVAWLNAPLQIGDEVRIRLIETDEVDAPIAEKRYETQDEQDKEVRSRLASARTMLPSLSQENDAATLALLDERLEQHNFVASMHLLAKLGEGNIMTAPYWIHLEWCAQILGRYEEGNKYSAWATALTPKDEAPSIVVAHET